METPILGGASPEKAEPGRRDKRQVAGWLAVCLSTLISGVWAFWGISENFHEGWYAHSWAANVAMMLGQYLSPMLLFMAATQVAIFWPRLGGGLHLLLALLAMGFFNAFSNAATFLIILPLLGIGGMYWYGRPQPRRRAALIAAGLPLLVLIAAGIEPAWRVAQRQDDGDLRARLVPGNGVALVWAPAGPGWPASGVNWMEAQQACLHLQEDGLSMAAEPQAVWRLPTAAEAVRSMARQGQNSGGVWDGEAAQATYQRQPDKESPLWELHSQVIYWWTATVVDADRAYIIVYDGRVWPRSKSVRLGYLGFRCVKEPAG